MTQPTSSEKPYWLTHAEGRPWLHDKDYWKEQKQKQEIQMTHEDAQEIIKALIRIEKRLNHLELSVCSGVWQ